MIEASYMNGSQRTAIYRVQSEGLHPPGLTLCGELHWMDYMYEQRAVMSFHIGERNEE